MLNLIVGALFATVGGATIGWSLWAAWQSFASRNWRTTQGVILVSDLQRNRDAEGGFMYRAEISYTYSVNNEEFIAGRTRFGDWLQLSWSTPAARIVRRYPKGSSVVVHYDPSEPAEAVLEPGASWFVLGALALGLVLGLLGLAAVLGQ